MTHTITIATDNVSHFEQIKRLANKLGVNTVERHETDDSGDFSAQAFLALQAKYPARKISKTVEPR